MEFRWHGGDLLSCSTMSKTSGEKIQRLRGDLKGWKLESCGGFLTLMLAPGWHEAPVRVLSLWSELFPGSWRSSKRKLSVPGDTGRILVAFYDFTSAIIALPLWLSDKEPACNAGDLDLIPGSGRSPGEGNGKLKVAFLPGESRRQRSLGDYSPWGWKRVGHDWAANTVNFSSHRASLLPYSIDGRDQQIIAWC